MGQEWGREGATVTGPFLGFKPNQRQVKLGTILGKPQEMAALLIILKQQHFSKFFQSKMLVRPPWNLLPFIPYPKLFFNRSIEYTY